MSEQIQEQLSALMDGELSPDATRFLLRRIDNVPELRQSWSRYHLMRGCLRHQQQVMIGEDFSFAVMRLIDAEQIAVMPRGRWLRWISGSAVAASVAVAALVMTRPAGQLETFPQQEVLVGSAHTPAVALGDFQPPALMQPASVTTSSNLAQPASFDPGMQSYLIRHYEAAGASGRAGFVPYVLMSVPSHPSRSPISAPTQTQERHADSP